MNDSALDDFVAAGLARTAGAAARALAARLAGDTPDARAVLFYGSNLRSGATDGVLDFYVLTGGAHQRGPWPRVGYREHELDGATLRAKVATMRLATFLRAAEARGADATIWARFVQPSALVWAADADAAAETRVAIAAAARSAAGIAALLGPVEGEAGDFWRALFRQTYRTELRVEAAGREEAIVATNAAHFAALLPIAWEAAGIAFAERDGRLAPGLSIAQRKRLARVWRRARLAGKPINVARLLRAARTFDGAARYGAWKIERHTGVAVPLTPWRERHPAMAAPGVLWRVWRARRR